MYTAPETLHTATTESAQMPKPVIREQGDCDSPTRMICDLADANAFVEEYRKPHVPVMSAFGGGRLHVCRIYGSWDLNLMVSENADTLFRSIRKLSFKDAKVSSKEWDDLTFQFGPRAFLYADKDRIIGFAATSIEAERLVTQFSKKYSKPTPPISAGGIFYLIEQAGDNIKTKEVLLSPDTILKPEALILHYGSSSGEWHQSFIRKLCDRTSGLSIFEGKPGTGKTFYLRHLMGELKESHRFYFIPTSAMGILSRSDFIGFWTDQRWHHSEKKFVVILEDSDAALMTRGSDNREQVSAILNLSDGIPPSAQCMLYLGDIEKNLPVNLVKRDSMKNPKLRDWGKTYEKSGNLSSKKFA